MSTFEIVLLLLLFLVVVGLFRIARALGLFVDATLTDIVRETIEEMEEMRNGED